MKLLGYLLAAALTLSVLRAAFTVMIGAIVLAVVIGLVRVPLQTLTVLFGLAVVQAFSKHPLGGLLLLVALLLSGKLLPVTNGGKNSDR